VGLGRKGLGPRSDNPTAMHQSPAAMFANIIARPVSGLTSALLRCWRIAFPHPSKGTVALRFAVTRLPLRGQRRNYSVSDHRMVKDQMHRLPVSLAVAPGRTGKTAEHLTTSPRMLTAVRGIGKRVNTHHPLASLVDNGRGPAMERFFSMNALAQ
jgi:hypothetical protein